MVEEEITVRVQKMFPNCEKYKKCCTDDKEFWDKMKEYKPYIPLSDLIAQQIKKQKSPEGFKGW